MAKVETQPSVNRRKWRRSRRREHPALEGHGLTKRYGGRAVVDNVEVRVGNGESGRTARSQRRGQDHDLLYAGRPAQARRGDG